MEKGLAHQQDQAETSAVENTAEDMHARVENTSADYETRTSSHSHKKKYRTLGNVIYDFGVFGSIAWIGVAVLSAVSAHEALHGNNKWFGWLRTLNDKSTEWLKEKLSKSLLKSASLETVEGYAKGTAMFLTLGMGGNALMAPIKWLEDHRQSNAAKIDNLLGTQPPDPETIAQEPKQTWKSVFSGRLASWGLSYAAFLAMGPKLTGKINNWCSERVLKGWMKLRPASDVNKVKNWTEIAAFDALFTIITATLTYTFSRIVAKKGENKYVADDLYTVNTAAPNLFGQTEESAHEETHDPSFTTKIQPRKQELNVKSARFSERLESEPHASHSIA